MAICGGNGYFSIFLIIFFLIWCGASCIMVYYGIDMIREGAEYAQYNQDTSKGKCLLIDYHEYECSYDCDCDSEGDFCSTCHGIEYDYIAIAESKCGNQTLSSHEYDKQCPGVLKSIGTEYECYVLPCEESEFSFETPEAVSPIGWGIVLMVTGGICLSGPCFIAYFMRKDGDF